MDKDDTVKIRIPNTKFWVIGERNRNNLWGAYIYDPETDRKELIKEDVTTRSFSMFSNTRLGVPFPHLD